MRGLAQILDVITAIQMKNGLSCHCPAERLCVRLCVCVFTRTRVSVPHVSAFTYIICSWLIMELGALLLAGRLSFMSPVTLQPEMT